MGSRPAGHFCAMQRSALLLAVLLAAAGARAQVVNIEGRRFANDTVPWTGFVNFRYNIAENTQRSIQFGLNGAVQHVRGRHTFFFINDLAVSRVESNEFLNTGFQHLRYNYNRTAQWTGEAFAQTQYNKPLQLDLRVTVGAGPRLRILANDRFRWHVGTALMLEHETTTPGERTLFGRNSTYSAATARFTDAVSLTGVVYYQPKLFDAMDHRVMVEAGLQVVATRHLTYESRLNLLKDTAQPPGIPDLSYSWQNMFGYRF